MTKRTKKVTKKPDAKAKAPAKETPAKEDDKPKPKGHGSVVPAETKKSYGPDQNNGDDVALSLKGKTIKELKALAKERGIDWTWDHLNPGMQRMNFGNKLRTVIAGGTKAEKKKAANAKKKAEAKPKAPAKKSDKAKKS